MIVVTHATLRNPAILAVRQLPRKFFGRVTVWPRGPVRAGTLLRIVIEMQWVRYTLALAPLVVIALIWNGAALPLSQAPVLMIAIIWWVEMRVLRVPPGRRARLVDPAEADRGLDLLRARARTVLSSIAAGRAMRAGQLRLVVEQSELRHLPPLTYVSVQSETGPEVLALNASERRAIADTLFRAPLDERALHAINQAQNVFLRDIAFDARAVSAHARLAAALA